MSKRNLFPTASRSLGCQTDIESLRSRLNINLAQFYSIDPSWVLRKDGYPSPFQITIDQMDVTITWHEIIDLPNVPISWARPGGPSIRDVKGIAGNIFPSHYELTYLRRFSPERLEWASRFCSSVGLSIDALEAVADLDPTLTAMPNKNFHQFGMDFLLDPIASDRTFPVQPYLMACQKLDQKDSGNSNTLFEVGHHAILNYGEWCGLLAELTNDLGWQTGSYFLPAILRSSQIHGYPQVRSWSSKVRRNAVLVCCAKPTSRYCLPTDDLKFVIRTTKSRVLTGFHPTTLAEPFSATAA